MKPKQKVVTIAEASRELDGIRKAASMAGRAMQRLETEAERIAPLRALQGGPCG
jgi:hypothetical protein